ncbi:MAG: 6-carboxytetrahydropterin synthase QueD [Epulopiscium sp. Nele67-Bin001]|nr:MAG: 6-carboxytetrahydropterin synthase QueD [Epulopiscium sp. Nele67-Bin001]
MFILKNEIQFDLAHYLSGYNGKCANIHGHRYKLVVKVASVTLHEQGQLRGMVDDFSNIKSILKEVENYFDHKLIIEDNEDGRKVGEVLSGFDILYFPHRTTAEEMSRFIYHMIKQKGINVYEVELYETPTNSCIYTEVDNK